MSTFEHVLRNVTCNVRPLLDLVARLVLLLEFCRMKASFAKTKSMTTTTTTSLLTGDKSTPTTQSWSEVPDSPPVWRVDNYSHNNGYWRNVYFIKDKSNFNFIFFVNPSILHCHQCVNWLYHDRHPWFSQSSFNNLPCYLINRKLRSCLPNLFWLYFLIRARIILQDYTNQQNLSRKIRFKVKISSN